MIADATLAVRDYARAKSFYTKVLATLGYRNTMEYGESAGLNDSENTDLGLSGDDTVVPTHLAFIARSKEPVQARHQSALAAGATDNGAPGYRDYSPGCCAAFVHDADQHNIEAVWYDPSKDK